MKRTKAVKIFKPKKMIFRKKKENKKRIRRTTKTKREYIPMEPKKNFGGCLPNPPNDCSKIQFIFLREGIRWIDLSICHSCDKIKECERRKEYLNKLKEERKQRLSPPEKPTKKKFKINRKRK